MPPVKRLFTDEEDERYFKRGNITEIDSQIDADIDEYFAAGSSETEYDNEQDFLKEYQENGEDNEEILDDIEWEDIPLERSNEEQDLTITIDKRDQSRKKRLEARRRNSILRQKILEIRKIQFGLHLVMIPILLRTLQNRVDWCKDQRLNRRLFKSVPKLIVKKFKKDIFSTTGEIGKLRTLLLGLIFWFRSNYKINSNGFRQNFIRLAYLLKFNSSSSGYTKKFLDIMNGQEKYYGSRPILDKEDPIETIRSMAKKKMANRDILVIFFLIILKNTLPTYQKLSLCFALPLINYKSPINLKHIASQMENGEGQVPNKFDSDLLEPYFWIELTMAGADEKMIIIDPIVHLEKDQMVSKVQIDERVSFFQPLDDFKLNINQDFTYVVSIDMDTEVITDVSPRYLGNLCYRYFDFPPDSVYRRSRSYLSYLWFEKYLKALNKVEDVKGRTIMKSIAFKHYSVPTTLKELRQSENFVTMEQLNAHQQINFSGSRPPLLFRNKVPLYWKDQVINLKSEQHWLILGRRLKAAMRPRRMKKHVNNRKYEIKGLYSFDQTLPSLRLPNTIVDPETGSRKQIEDVNYYKNKYGHVEIYCDSLKPKGFEFFQLDPNGKIKALIKQYNKKIKGKHSLMPFIKYVEVVSGFDFKQKRGFAIPLINKILVKENDLDRIRPLVQESNELEGLQCWRKFLSRMSISNRLEAQYGDA
ncbi:hypothetical protein KAFR_0K02230 [Kazachstania africana CBS 2517]|uniref:Rad4 beta-hairpin domain-containing protein n=1 Tax=Kazachstania africana (strain ATCC 22294 / BCRC 22015 / CBS 2517 / CECT 1963 / NBRC 1671 / NRRL Y-8276) TaxID=1071382 RepID=H2B1S7_KAZAF|nr:hypothetical protein KAFR_0K02230 [Kazachstania africana CBS 2517]CCF60577.1 hypothetical protein KAFR_0K02230 [Kazachstania africana CBS 2517]